MTDKIKEKIYSLLTMIGSVYNEQPNETKLKVYCSILKEYDIKLVSMAIKESIKTCKYYPSIAELIEIIENKTTVSQVDEANEMAGAILEAVRIYGYNNETEAERYLGPDSWHVVERFGGWRTICMIDISQLNTARAQLRSLAQAALSYKSKAGDLKPQVEYQKETIKRLSVRDTIDYLEALPEQVETSC